MKSNAAIVYKLCLIIGDFAALLAAFVGAYLLRVTYSSKPLEAPVHARTYLLVFLVVLPFWLIIFALIGLYNSDIYENRFKELGRLLVGSFIGMLFVVFWNFIAAKPILPARLVPILGFALGFVFLLLIRNVIRWARAILFGYDIGLTNVVIIGNTSVTDELLEQLHNSRKSGYYVQAVVNNKKSSTKINHIPRFTSFKSALEHIDVPAMHVIIQTELYAEENKNREVLDFAQEHHLDYRFVPGNTELFVGNIEVELFRSQLPVIVVHQTALFGWGKVVKRGFDIAVASLALIIVSPIMLLVALVLEIFDRGNIIFGDKRLTRFDEVVTVYKFRSHKHVYNGLSPEQAFEKMGKPELALEYRKNGDQIENDPRIGKIGRFLRRSSLDELPQLINVIKGDISLVGPRALVPYELQQYPKKNLLLSVKTGITGLAQVSGRSDLTFEERRNLDLYYVQNWSFWLDITILMKTIRVVLNQRGSR